MVFTAKDAKDTKPAALVQGNSLCATFYSLFYRVELMNP